MPATPNVAGGPVAVPRLLYGTAWKEAQTARLVTAALQAGFRGIDTANQRKHYHEAAVGEAVQAQIRSGALARGNLFLQTKFTHPAGQDHRLPYDAGAPMARQVEQSFASSLEHLGVETLDAYLLHGPSVPLGWGEDDLEAWAAMEDLHRAGSTRLLGVSNVSADQLDELVAIAKVPPAIVQNRCFTRPHADAAVRESCTRHGILYQGFSLLTGHRLVGHPVVLQAAARLAATPPQVVFAYCLARGLHVLTGTTSAEHMAQDLLAPNVVLTPGEETAMDSILSWSPSLRT
ncbi:MAG: aldo/keto reductase [Candidatus Thermoplasmatota archaeon]